MNSAPPKLATASRIPPPSRSITVINWVVGAVAIATVVSWLQFSVASICCADFDGYDHIKWSRLLWDGLRHGHLPKFPFTTLSASNYEDQHFLYHLFLIPFAWSSLGTFSPPMKKLSLAAPPLWYRRLVASGLQHLNGDGRQK